MKNIVLLSGGVDSLTTTLMLMKRKVTFQGVYLYLGHKYGAEERETVLDLYHTLDVDGAIFDFENIGIFEKDNAEIPFRNDMLILFAAMMGATDIYLSVEQGTEDNLSRDRSPEFMERIEHYLSWRVRDGIYVHNLVGEMTKQDEMKWILDNYPIMGDMYLKETFSCYTPNLGMMCGNCKACIRWFLAAIPLGIERSDWGQDPRKSKVLQKYILDVNSGKYGGRRGQQYKEAFAKLGVKL